MYREHHKVEPLIFNPELAAQAYEYACELATANKGLTSSNPGKGKNQGENLFWNWSQPRKEQIFMNSKGTDTWYNEIENFDFSNPVDSK